MEIYTQLKKINMKKFTTIAAIAAIMIASVTVSNAQTDVKSATATATATIITPITITKVNDLNFGNIVSTSTGGTVVLSAAGARTESGVQLPTATGTITAASFTITGESGYAYGLTLPTEDYTLTTGAAGATQTMTLNAFTSDKTATIAGGSVILSVGATLNLAANQVAGIYTNATPFTVSVNYN